MEGPPRAPQRKFQVLHEAVRRRIQGKLKLLSYERVCILTPVQKGTQSSVTLEDDSAFDVGLMLEYFYEKTYWATLPAGGSNDTPSTELEVHVRMGAMGEKFLCEDLVEFAKYQFVNGFKRRGLELYWRRTNDPAGWKASLLNEMLALVPQIFGASDHPLRQSFLNCFQAGVNEREVQSGISLSEPVVVDTIKEYPEFAIKLFEHLNLRLG